MAEFGWPDPAILDTVSAVAEAEAFRSWPNALPNIPVRRESAGFTPARSPEAAGSAGQDAEPGEPVRITYGFIQGFCQMLQDWRKEIIFHIGDWEIGRTTISLFDDGDLAAEASAPPVPQFVNAPLAPGVHEYWNNLQRTKRVADPVDAGLVPPQGRTLETGSGSIPLPPAAGAGASAAGGAGGDPSRRAVEPPTGETHPAESQPPATPAGSVLPENPYRPGFEESEAEWQQRLFRGDGAATAERRAGNEAAAVERRTLMNKAIAAEPGFLSNYPAYAQLIDPSFYADPVGFVAELRAMNPDLGPDPLKEVPDPTLDKLDPAANDRISTFIQSNGNPWFVIAANGKVYDMSRIRHFVRRPAPKLVTLFDYDNVVLQQHALNEALEAGDLSRLPPELWAAMAMDVGRAPIGLARPFAAGRSFSRPPLPLSDDVSRCARPEERLQRGVAEPSELPTERWPPIEKPKGAGNEPSPAPAEAPNPKSAAGTEGSGSRALPDIGIDAAGNAAEAPALPPFTDPERDMDTSGKAVDNPQKTAADSEEVAAVAAGRQPTFTLGASDGGPGTWVESPKYPTDPADAAFQQSATGAPAGLEYAVPTNQTASGIKYFDGFDPRAGKLIDAKNYINWPQEYLGFSMDAAIAELGQNDAIAGELGMILEIRVASQAKADLLQSIANRQGFENILIRFWGNQE